MISIYDWVCPGGHLIEESSVALWPQSMEVWGTGRVCCQPHIPESDTLTLSFSTQQLFINTCYMLYHCLHTFQILAKSLAVSANCPVLLFSHRCLSGNRDLSQGVPLDAESSELATGWNNSLIIITLRLSKVEGFLVSMCQSMHKRSIQKWGDQVQFLLIICNAPLRDSTGSIVIELEAQQEGCLCCTLLTRTWSAQKGTRIKALKIKKCLSTPQSCCCLFITTAWNGCQIIHHVIGLIWGLLYFDRQASN